ncbi:hypothetical protein DFH28DRAFT_1160606 [Melampsora americana]|nr:hypothetical protein DFH28DRAFT_1160606 [Melampsora americana]
MWTRLKKGLNNFAQRFKGISGIDWIEGECRIDMPAEWWHGYGMDADRFQYKPSIFYNEMDVLLHESRPAGALHTGTSSDTAVKAKNNEDVEDVGVEHNKEQEDVDAEGLTQAEIAPKDSSQEAQQSKVKVINKTGALELAQSPTF